MNAAMHDRLVPDDSFRFDLGAILGEPTKPPEVCAGCRAGYRVTDLQLVNGCGWTDCPYRSACREAPVVG